MTRRTGSSIVLGLLIWGIGFAALSADPAASDPIVTRQDTVSRTVAVNVKQVVEGNEYKGVVEFSRCGIAHISEYAVYLEFSPWDQVSGWKCFGTKQEEPNEQDLCPLWVQVQKGTPDAKTGLFFKVPCEMVPGMENWEVIEAFDPRGRF